MANRIGGERDEESTAQGPSGRAGAVVQDIERETLEGSIVSGAPAPPDALHPEPRGPGKRGGMGGGSRDEQDTTGYTDGPGRFGTGTSED